MGLKLGFKPTANIMWTYRVTHLEWARNQPMGLKLVFKHKGSSRIRHYSRPRGRERRLGFFGHILLLAQSSPSRFPGRLVRVDTCRGCVRVISLRAFSSARNNSNPRSLGLIPTRDYSNQGNHLSLSHLFGLHGSMVGFDQNLFILFPLCHVCYCSIKTQ